MSYPIEEIPSELIPVARSIRCLASISNITYVYKNSNYYYDYHGTMYHIKCCIIYSTHHLYRSTCKPQLVWTVDLIKYF